MTRGKSTPGQRPGRESLAADEWLPHDRSLAREPHSVTSLPERAHTFPLGVECARVCTLGEKKGEG